MHIKIKDLDFDNNVVYVSVTKNRKPLIVPLNHTMVNILSEYLKYRKHKTTDDYLFCNSFGRQLVKSACILCSTTATKAGEQRKTVLIATPYLC